MRNGIFIIRYGLVPALLCGVLSASAAEERELSGRVAGPDGRAVAGAEVCFYAVGADEQNLSYVIKELGKTRTNRQGQFAFTTATFGEFETVCLVKAEGLSRGWADFYSFADTMDVSLTAPSPLAGVVRDAAGKPVAGVQVRLSLLTIPSETPVFLINFEPIDAFTIVTGEDGRFEFADLPATATAEILVKKAGMATLHTLTDRHGFTTGFTYKAGQTDIELTLPAGCTLTGKAEDADGQEAAGVRVHAFEPEMPISLLGHSAVSGEDGVFRMEDLAPGVYKLVTQSESWVAEPVEVTVQGDTETTVALRQGGVLEVKVVDRETGEGIAGATTWMRLEGADQSKEIKTGADGIASQRLLAGRYTLSIRTEGYQPAHNVETVEVMEGQTAAVQIPLDGLAKVAGRVLDAEGKPVEGAEVQVLMEHDHKAKSDGDGRFEVKWNPSQIPASIEEHHLIALHPDRNLAGVAPLGDGSAPVTAVLREGARAQGRVIGEDGKTLAGVLVRIFFQGEMYGTYFGLDGRTDAEGRYEVACLPADHRFSVEIGNAKGYGTASLEFDTENGSAVTVEDIELAVADRRVTGQVIDADGKPVEKVQIYSYGEGQPRVRAQTDAEGKFVLENVCEGRLRISANYMKGSTYLHGFVETEGGAEDIQIVLGARETEQFIPRKPASMVGRKLGEVLAANGVSLPADANSVALFVWDMNQRPSRHFVKAFAQKAATLKEKGITSVLLQAGATERAAVDAWLKENGIDCPCGMIEGDAEAVELKLGVQRLPWLVLTDEKGTVAAEGLSVEELNAKLNSLTGEKP